MSLIGKCSGARGKLVLNNEPSQIPQGLDKLSTDFESWRGNDDVRLDPLSHGVMWHRGSLRKRTAQSNDG